MTDPVTPPPATGPDEAQVKTKFKSWISEVLDERDTKAAADREAKVKKDAEDAQKAKDQNPLNALFSGLFGKM